MNKDSSSIQVSEEPSELIISYSTSSRLESTALLAICLIALAMCYYLLYRSPTSIFSDNDWLLIPMCLFGSAWLIALVLRSGTAKSPITINTDGMVSAGIATWKFPGRATVFASKTGRTTAPSYWIDFRYGSATIRLPGGVTEGSTMGVAAQINRWSRDRIQGTADPFESGKVKFSVDWGSCYFIFMIVVAMSGVVVGGDGIYLDTNAPFGSWAKISILIFSGLMVVGAGIRWAALIRAGVRRGLGIWTAEVLVAMLLILGGGAIVGHFAQAGEMRVTENTQITFGVPLHLTRTTTGKGCHRFILIEEPSLGHSIKYCDPHSLEYWNGITEVRVGEQKNQLGIRITSVDRTVRP